MKYKLLTCIIILRIIKFSCPTQEEVCYREHFLFFFFDENARFEDHARCTKLLFLHVHFFFFFIVRANTQLQLIKYKTLLYIMYSLIWAASIIPKKTQLNSKSFISKFRDHDWTLTIIKLLH